MFFSNWFKTAKPKAKSIAFLDGDQPLPGIIAAYDKYLKGTETHLVRTRGEGSGEPHILRGDFGFNKIYLTGYTARKEITDKFIGAYIQKAVSDGYTEITVVSSDYDFIDTFKMAVVLDSSAANVTFRMIIPHAKGRLQDLPDSIRNISIIRE
jgi:hypothetical protein